VFVISRILFVGKLLSRTKFGDGNPQKKPSLKVAVLLQSWLSRVLLFSVELFNAVIGVL